MKNENTDKFAKNYHLLTAAGTRHYVGLLCKTCCM